MPRGSAASGPRRRAPARRPGRPRPRRRTRPPGPDLRGWYRCQPLL